MNGFFNAGIDPYAVMLAEAKQQGLESLISFRMNDAHSQEFLQPEFWTDNPGYRLGYGFDFGQEAVRDYTFNLIQEAVQRYDSDGIELDFNRFPTFFQNGTTEERIATINSLVQRVRTLLDEEGVKRGKHLTLTARVPSNYGNSPPTYATSLAIGCDPVAWAENGWVDYLTVSEFLYEEGTLPIESWKELITEVPVYGGIEAVMPGGAHLTPEQYRLAARNLWGKGADGIYLFNFFTPRQIGNEPPFEVLKDLGAPPEPSSVDLSGYFNADTIGVSDTDAGGTGYYDPAEDFKFIDFTPIAGFTTGPVGANGADSPNTVLLDMGGSYSGLGPQAPISVTIDVDDAVWGDFSVLQGGFRPLPDGDGTITVTYTDATTQVYSNWQIVTDAGGTWAESAGDATVIAVGDRYRVDPATGLIGGSCLGQQMFLGVDTGKLVDTITFDITGIDSDGIAQVGVYAVSYTPAELQTYVAGDADRNGVVDAADAAILASNWQSNNATWAMGDFNDDNVVNDVDATLLATNWQSGSASASVPEPSTLALLMIGCFVLRTRKTRRS